MWRIVKSNCKNNIVGMVVVLIFILISVILMGVGLTISFKIDTLYDEKIESTGDADLLIYASNQNNFIQFLHKTVKNSKYIKDSELYIDTVLYLDEMTNIHGTYTYVYSYLMNLDAPSKYPYKVVEKENVEGNVCYISLYGKYKENYKVGDKITMKSNGRTMEFVVGGFVDTVGELYNMSNIWVTEDLYNETRELFNGNANDAYIIKATMKDNSMASVNQFVQDFFKKSSVISSVLQFFDSDFEDVSVSINGVPYVRQTGESFVIILGVLLMVFALIIAMIAVIIIRFLIISAIEDNIRGIGVLKSIGYSTREIRYGYLIQYLSIAVLAILIGVIATYCAMPFFVGILTTATNLVFNVPVNFGAVAISIVLIICIVLATVYVVSRRINKITPIMALRRGVETHSFKKNHFRLDKVKANPNVTISLKSIANNKKQSIMIVVISLLMTMLCAFTSTLFYNMNVNTGAIENILGVEACDIYVWTDIKTNDKILSLPEIDKYSYGSPFGGDMMIVEDIGVTALFSSDYSIYRTNPCYKGRLPMADNEVAISSNTAKDSGKTIGDMIKVSTPKGTEAEFLVTGLTQSMNNPYTIHISSNAFENLVDYSIKNNLMIYLKEGVDREEVIVKIAEIMGTNSNVVDVRAQIDINLLGTLAPSSAALMGVMLVVSVLVVIMVMLMIIKLKVLRENRNMAIMKAQGYTTLNLITQITLSMIILTAIGSILGALLGALLSSPILELVLAGYGIMKMTLAVNWFYILGIVIALNFVTFIIASLVALNTRRVSPRELISN